MVNAESDKIPWVGQTAPIYSSCSHIQIECWGEYGKHEKCKDCIFKKDCIKEKDGQSET